MLIEVLLQLLVGEIDIELLKPIYVKVLETKDVEHTNEREALCSSLYSSIDFLQYPAEQVCIEPH